MYNIIKSVILSKRFELSDMLKKIDVFFVQNDITSENRDELIELARNNADMQFSVNLMEKLNNLDDRIKRIEETLFTASDEFKPYDKNVWYKNGDKILFESKKYICTATQNKTVVWSPKDAPQYWKEVN